MASLSQGDGSEQKQSIKPTQSREVLLNRLTERHEQLKAAQLCRAQERKQRLDVGQSEKSYDFLPRFLQTKAEILSDLNEACTKMSSGSSSLSTLTKFFDDIVLRVEEMQRSLNEASLYLTPFDSEQARLELKDLNSQFQDKREQLLPSKKFSFSRKPKSNPQPDHSQIVQTKPEDTRPQLNHESLQSFNPDFSLINICGPTELFLPKSCTSGSEKCDPNALLGQSIYLANLKLCTIYVFGVCGNLIARHLNQCRLYTFPVAGSVWIEDCQDCDLVLACRQLRIHQTNDCRLGLHMASRPIIEHSSGLLVAPYPLHHTDLPKQLELAGLSLDVNRWNEVEDFSHPNKRLTTGSPNWSVLSESEWSSLQPLIDLK